MSLSFVPVLENFKDMDKLDALNKEAFPVEERIPTKQLVELGKTDYVDLLAIYKGDVFIGFFTIIVGKGYAYIFFFAIDSSIRSKGYGGKALRHLKEYYPNTQIALDMEAVDENALNNKQRMARKDFYLRNGYKETKYLLEYFEMTFEVLSLEGILDKDIFFDLFQKIVPVLETTNPKVLAPKLYEKG